METKYFMIKLIFCLLSFVNVQAQEGAQKEAPAETAAPTSDQKAGKELAEVEKQVASLAAKIKAKNDSIESLLTQKSVEKDPEKIIEMVKLVQSEHREMEKLTIEYNAQLGILQYRFPERGVTQGRRYQRLNTKSLDEMEKTLGLEANLKRSREKVKTVYGIKEKPAAKKEGSIKKDPNAGESLLQPATLSK